MNPQQQQQQSNIQRQVPVCEKKHSAETVVVVHGAADQLLSVQWQESTKRRNRTDVFVDYRDFAAESKGSDWSEQDSSNHFDQVKENRFTIVESPDKNTSYQKQEQKTTMLIKCGEDNADSISNKDAAARAIDITTSIKKTLKKVAEFLDIPSDIITFELNDTLYTIDLKEMRIDFQSKQDSLQHHIVQEHEKQTKSVQEEEPYDPLSFLMDNDEDFMTPEVKQKEPDPCTTQESEQMIRSDKEIDIGFLFASPVVLDHGIPGQDQELVEFAQISWKKELKLIKDEVKRQELSMKIESQVATTQKLIDMLKKQLRVMHISCHGFKDTENQLSMSKKRPSMGLSSQMIDHELQSNFLLFEMPTGEGELVDAASINELLKQGSIPMLDLVVLQACHSEIVGRVFQENCARHVICIDQDRSVLDEASIKFTQNLYKNLLSGESICMAFDHAVGQAKLVLGRGKEHEAEKEKLFKLLLHENHPSNKNAYSQPKHHCRFVVKQGETPKGQLQCLSDHILLKNLPPYDLKEAKYRPKERQEVIKALCCDDRLISLQGLYGDGKNTIAASCVRFVADRKIFSGGIICLNLQRITSCRSFLLKLKQNLANKLPQWSDDKFKTIQGVTFEEDFTNFLINFFNQTDQFRIEHHSKHIQKENRLKFLMLLENVEDIIHCDDKNFKKFLKDVFTDCGQLSILMTSYEWIGRVSDSIMPTIINILELDHVNAVKLFMESTGEFKPEEVLKLVLENPTDCLDLLLPNFEYDAQLDFTDDQMQLMLIKLKADRDTRVRVLSSHDLFKQLNGNPYSISTLSAFYRNPFVEGNDLTGIYRRLISSDFYSNSSQISSNNQGGNDLNKSKPKLNKKISPQMRTEAQIKTIEATLSVLKEKSSTTQLGCLDLFYFLGCFSSGISHECLQSIWPNNSLDDSLYLFQRLGLMDTSVQRKTLNRFLTKFVIKSDFENLNPTLMTLLCKYYTDLLKKLHNLDVPFEDINTDKAWKDIQLYPKNSQNGIKRSMSYMQSLIKQIQNPLEKSKSSIINSEQRQKYLEVIQSFRDELLNFEVILNYYQKHKNIFELADEVAFENQMRLRQLPRVNHHNYRRKRKRMLSDILDDDENGQDSGSENSETNSETVASSENYDPKSSTMVFAHDSQLGTADIKLDLLAQIDQLPTSLDDQGDADKQSGSLTQNNINGGNPLLEQWPIRPQNEIMVEELDTKEQFVLINQYPRNFAINDSIQNEESIFYQQRTSDLQRQISVGTVNSTNSRKSRVNFHKNQVAVKITPVKKESCEIVICGMNANKLERQSQNQLVAKIQNKIQKDQDDFERASQNFFRRDSQKQLVRFKTVYQKRYSAVDIDGSKQQEDSQSQSRLEGASSKTQISTEEHFFLYLLSGFITVGDAQQCIQLYNMHFDNLIEEESILFKANMMRLKALATLKCLLNDDQFSDQQDEHVIEATKLTNEALELFAQVGGETKREAQLMLHDPCFDLRSYGTALCQLQASYIQENFKFFKQTSSDQTIYHLALQEDTLSLFEQINHLKGIELTLESLIRLKPNCKSLQEKKKATEAALEKINLEQSCYRRRDPSSDITLSVISELVLLNNPSFLNLFPIQKTAIRRSSLRAAAPQTPQKGGQQQQQSSFRTKRQAISQLFSRNKK